MMCLHLLSLKDSVLSDPLNDVLVLVESLTLVDVDALTDVCLHLMSLERLALADVDPLNDVLALAEFERLVLVDSLNDVLVLVESLTLVDVDALTDVLCT